MNLGDYQTWRDTARRLSRRAADADDLLQEALLAALQAGRTDLADPDNARWFHGVLRNKAAMTARTEGRRRRREDAAATPEASDHGSDDGAVGADAARDAARDVAALLARLPRGARVVAALVLHGMTREEITSALQISDTSFRQRLTVIRRALAAGPENERHAAIAQAYLRQQRRERGADELDLGPIRHALLSLLQRDTPQGREGVGTHDPDGHLLVIRQTGSGTARPAPGSASQSEPPRQRPTDRQPPPPATSKE